jgi:hypothetical protein
MWWCMVVVVCVEGGGEVWEVYGVVALVVAAIVGVERSCWGRSVCGEHRYMVSVSNKPPVHQPKYYAVLC